MDSIKLWIWHFIRLIRFFNLFTKLRICTIFPTNRAATECGTTPWAHRKTKICICSHWTHTEFTVSSSKLSDSFIQVKFTIKTRSIDQMMIISRFKLKNHKKTTKHHECSFPFHLKRTVSFVSHSFWHHQIQNRCAFNLDKFRTLQTFYFRLSWRTNTECCPSSRAWRKAKISVHW